MSLEAITWSLSQPVKHSTAKFVLVVMANYADAELRCWPSMALLCETTAQDRKTVQENIRRLREWGYIEDTGERRGTTKQVIVYQLKQPEIGPLDGGGNGDQDASNLAGNSTENGLLYGSNSAEKEGTKRPEIGLVKEAQKRNTSENGTVPFFPPKRPNFPGKEAQFSLERGPKTGHGTVYEQSRNHQGTRNTRTADDFDAKAELQKLGVDDQHASDWLTVRKAKRAPLTRTALADVVREAAKAGVTTGQAIEIAAQRGWQTFRSDWVQPKNAVRPQQQLPLSREEQNRLANEEAKRIVLSRLNPDSEVIDADS